MSPGLRLPYGSIPTIIPGLSHPSPTHRLSCQLLGGDGSHLERGPEDPFCRIVSLQNREEWGWEQNRGLNHKLPVSEAFAVQKRATELPFPGQAGSKDVLWNLKAETQVRDQEGPPACQGSETWVSGGEGGRGRELMDSPWGMYKKRNVPALPHPPSLHHPRSLPSFLCNVMMVQKGNEPGGLDPVPALLLPSCVTLASCFTSLGLSILMCKSCGWVGVHRKVLGLLRV